MVKLELLEEKDYEKIVQWNKDKDANFLYQWAEPGYDYPITEEKIAKRIAEGANSNGGGTYIYKIGAVDSNEMIGTIELFRINKENKSATIGRFLIDDKSRNKGIGKAALKMLVDKAFKQIGLDELNLRVFDFNEGAIICYEKVGFKKTRFIENARKTEDGNWGVYEMRITRNSAEYNSICQNY